MITTQVLLENTRDLQVLYVEDDLELQVTTKELLAIYFKKIDTANDGQEGLEKYKEFHAKDGEYYDLVITDLHMPVLSGIEMSKSILTIHETQSIIMITAYNSVEYLMEAISLGIDGYLIKPMSHENLSTSLFKATRAISDHKMLDRYIQEVENLNVELQDSNQMLQDKNQELEKSLRMLDTVISKEEIINPKPTVTLALNDDEIRKQEDIKNQLLQLINDDLYELKDILTEIDVCVIDTINHIENVPQENLDSLIKYFARYAGILNYYTFFNELSFAMLKFSKTMQETALPNDKESVKNVFVFLETFVYVLSKWQNDISSGDENKLNQLDASMISDMETIINLWIQKEEEIAENSLDDIFDF